MKLLRFIGLAAAAAMLFAFPAVAAVSPGPVLDHIQAAPSVNDCLASFDHSAVMVFAPAETRCDATMAELTGHCLQRVSPASMPLGSTSVLDPDLNVTCIPARGSGPPG